MQHLLLNLFSTFPSFFFSGKKKRLERKVKINANTTSLLLRFIWKAKSYRWKLSFVFWLHKKLVTFFLLTWILHLIVHLEHFVSKHAKKRNVFVFRKFGDHHMQSFKVTCFNLHFCDFCAQFHHQNFWHCCEMKRTPTFCVYFEFFFLNIYFLKVFHCILAKCNDESKNLRRQARLTSFSSKVFHFRSIPFFLASSRDATMREIKT